MKTKKISTEKKILWLFILSSLFLICTHSTLGVLLDSYTQGVDGDGFGNVAGTQGMGYSFNVSSTYYINRIDLPLKYVTGALTGTINLSIRLNSTGTTLGYAIINASILTSSYNNISWNFLTPILVNASTIYRMVLFKSGVEANYVGITYKDTAGYPYSQYNYSTSSTFTLRTANRATNYFIYGPSPLFTFNTPSESGTTKYLPNNYLLVNVTANITNFQNMTINVYNSSGLYTSYFTTNSSQFKNFSLPLIDGTYYYNITAANSTNQSINSETYTNYISYAQLNLSLYNLTNAYASSNITLYDLNASTSSIYVVNGTRLLNIILGYSYYISIDDLIFASSNTSYTSSQSGLQHLNISVYPSNTINLSFYDLVTLNKITEFLTIIQTTNLTKTYNTSSGSLFITNLSLGANEFRAYNTNYTESKVTIIVEPRTYYTQNLYLAKGTTTSNVTFIFFNPVGVLTSNVYMEQYAITNSSTTLTMSGYSDIAGRVYFSYNPNYYYMYSCSHPDYLCDSFYLNPPKESSYDITLRSLGSDITYSGLNINGSIAYNNVTNMLSFNYISGESMSSYAYTVSKIVNSSIFVICSNSSSASLGIFYCNVSNYDGYLFVQGTADSNIFFGQYVYVKNANVLSDVVEAKDGSFWAGLLSLVVILAASSFGVIGILIGSIISMIIILWLGLINFMSISMIAVGIIGSLVIAFIVRRR